MRSIFYCCLAALLIVATYSTYGQAKHTSSSAIKKAEQLYTRAISEYIDAMYKPGVTRPDTLFIGRNVDMPRIQLPRTINGLNILMLTSEEGERKLSYRKTLIYLNVVGWIDPQKSEFIIVAFNAFKPQHNCNMHFSHTPVGDNIKLDSLSFQYPYTVK